MPRKPVNKSHEKRRRTRRRARQVGGVDAGVSGISPWSAVTKSANDLKTMTLQALYQDLNGFTLSTDDNNQMEILSNCKDAFLLMQQRNRQINNIPIANLIQSLQSDTNKIFYTEIENEIRLYAYEGDEKHNIRDLNDATFLWYAITFASKSQDPDQVIHFLSPQDVEQFTSSFSQS